jgi:hypothetical protein
MSGIVFILLLQAGPFISGTLGTRPETDRTILRTTFGQYMHIYIPPPNGA